MGTEANFKSTLVDLLRKTYPGYIILRHEDRFTFGVPDISVTGSGRTSWWEAKHADPDFKSKGQQDLTMLRMAAAGYARHIIWEERDGGQDGTIKRTLIVHPKHLANWSTEYESMVVGHNHRWLVAQIGKVHVP